MPLLVRTDTLQYLDPRDVIADFKFPDFSKSYSGRMQALKPDQIERLGGMMVWDLNKKQAVPLHREQVGYHFVQTGIDPALMGTFRVKLLNGREVDVIADLADVPRAPAGLRSGHRGADHARAEGPHRPVRPGFGHDQARGDAQRRRRLPLFPYDGNGTSRRADLNPDWEHIKPAAIHNGEGTNHYFHMTTNSRAAAMVCIITGNVGKFGTGCHTWSGNYKAGIWNATPWSGAGLAVHTGEDPFNQTLDPNAHGKEIKTKSYYYGEEVGYWNHGDTALIVNTPKYGRKVFTGKTHMPSPSKVRWVTNVNMFEQRQAPL